MLIDRKRIAKLPITRYVDKSKADAIAEMNNKSDPDWTYTVKSSGDRFVIVVADETGFELGAL